MTKKKILSFIWKVVKYALTLGLGYLAGDGDVINPLIS